MRRFAHPRETTRHSRRFTLAGFSRSLREMPDPVDPRDHLTLLLARAFDRAWMRYYGPKATGTIPEEIARPELAQHLVKMAKDGVTDEAALAAAGVLHLLALTRDNAAKK
jgi:hypothetical protein